MRPSLPILLLLAALPAMVQAQDLPALYAVTGVAADDVLNVREHPRATADRIGALTPDATEVEVVAISDSGDWGLVNVGEGAGWVRMRFLAASDALAPGETYFDRPLACYGTEPFWDVAIGTDAATLTTPDSDPATLARDWSHAASGRGAWSQAAGFGSDDGGRMTVIVRRGECNDGMSDRDYGLSGEVLVERETDERILLSGCCSIAP